MISANIARCINKVTEDNISTKELSKINKMIIKRAKKGKNYITIYFEPSTQTLKTLENLGYKVVLESSSVYSIYWNYI